MYRGTTCEHSQWTYLIEGKSTSNLPQLLHLTITQKARCNVLEALLYRVLSACREEAKDRFSKRRRNTEIVITSTTPSQEIDLRLLQDFYARLKPKHKLVLYILLITSPLDRRQLAVFFSTSD
jgi:hypothetical protein